MPPRAVGPISALAAVWLLAGCVSSASGLFQLPPDAGTGEVDSAGPTLTLRDYAFAPEELLVAPGDTITVQNLDGDSHSLVSQSSPGDYLHGEVNGLSFLTPPFTGRWTLTIPADTPPGTVVYYFCGVHGPDGHQTPAPRISVQ